HWLKWRDRDTWKTFAEVADLYERSWRELGRQFSGLGFFLGDGWSGVDLDGVRDPKTGKLTREAVRIVDVLNTYVETSPSGAGIKFLLRGAVPTLTPTPLGDGQGTLESYAWGRFFAITGNVLGGAPPEPQERLTEAAAIVNEIASKTRAARESGEW